MSKRCDVVRRRTTSTMNCSRRSSRWILRCSRSCLVALANECSALCFVLSALLNQRTKNKDPSSDSLYVVPDAIILSRRRGARGAYSRASCASHTCAQSPVSRARFCSTSAATHDSSPHSAQHSADAVALSCNPFDRNCVHTSVFQWGQRRER